MLKTLLHSLKSGDWAKALDFLSPSFFEVVPTLGMTRIIGQLTRNYVNRSLTAETRQHWAAAVSRLDPSLSMTAASKASPGDPAAVIDSYGQGQALLKLYFASILSPTAFFLDLRSEQFHVDGMRLEWQPKAWIHGWSPAFQKALQSIYQGFYEDRPEDFQQGLKALNLEHAEKLFLEIFGEARDHEVWFRLDQFQASFHRVFVSCLTHKTQLHPEFLPLGLLLFGLYEHAQRLGVPLKPKLAWQMASEFNLQRLAKSQEYAT